MIDPEFAKYGATGIALACLLLIFWVFKFNMGEREKSNAQFYELLQKTQENFNISLRDIQDRNEKRDEASIKAIDKLTIAFDKHDKTSHETLTFLKKLNGSLPNLVEKKQRQKNETK